MRMVGHQLQTPAVAAAAPGRISRCPGAALIHNGGMEPLYLPPGYMSAHQTARTLDITLSGVRDLVHRGRLQRSGGTPRQPWYDSSAVLALVRDRQPA